MKTLIYRDNGEVYLGEHTIQNLSYWRWYGRQKNQKYMYKGYRYLNYINNCFDKIKDIVIVYTNNKWYNGELVKRKANGFLGIREYTL